MYLTRLVGRSLRWSIVEPLSEGLSFGLVSLMLSLIVAIPVFHETADQHLAGDSDATVCLPDCRAGPTSACATYNSIPVNELPEVLIKATIATQDPRFYSHFGIDLAAFAASFHSSPQVDGLQSSISQQVATILYPSNERTFEDRIREALLAIWLEWRLTKHEILTIYLNRVQIGAGIFGVGEAARLYFKKQVEDVGVSEAAVLVGLLNEPTELPSHHAPPNVRIRANVVLDKLVRTGFITEGQVLGAREYLARQVLKPEEDPLK
ncbi:transglycosylase domain-containing protein [Bradyrhizobium canariense]|nr:transglycosylase domain-containing protein [Bradyrhizobium canariense]